MIQPDTSAADIPAPGVDGRRVPEPRAGQSRSREPRRSARPVTASAPTHPANTRHTAGRFQRLKHIEGRRAPTTAASHTDCTTGSAPPAGPALPDTAAMAIGSTGANPATATSAAPTETLPSTHPAVRAQARSTRSGHDTPGWTANCSPRISRIDVSAAILLTASIRDPSSSVVVPFTATACSPESDHQRQIAHRSAVCCQRPEGSTGESRQPEGSQGARSQTPPLRHADRRGARSDAIATAQK